MDDAYDPTTYGAAIADEYDAMYRDAFDTDAAVGVLAELADGGEVLEFGIGTGRLAIPLAQQGLAVHGVDASPHMVEKLREKPGADAIAVTIGDFADVEVKGKFALVVLAINTIFACPDQDAQVAVFANAARHLVPGGHFVVEAWIPDLARFHRGRSLWPRAIGANAVALEAATIDPVRQTMETTQVRFTEGGLRLYPANHRYAWPAELDLMARLSGMRLFERWQDWRRSPCTPDSATHISIYES
jgi:SAM-dependent methyltransferase